MKNPLTARNEPATFQFVPQHLNRRATADPAQYWVRSTNHLAPCYAVSSIPPLPRPS